MRLCLTQSQAPVKTEGMAYLDPNETFRYTVNSELTKAQRKFYDENGFLVVQKLVPLEKLDRYG